ncbi:hypothetical protein U1Q18_019036 [Sarracenia purpurea var. burkii]
MKHSKSNASEGILCLPSLLTLAAVCGPLPLCAAAFDVAPSSAPPTPPSSSSAGSLSPSLERFELTWSLHLRRCFRHWSGSPLLFRQCLRRCGFFSPPDVQSFIAAASLLLLCSVFVPAGS